MFNVMQAPGQTSHLFWTHIRIVLDESCGNTASDPVSAPLGIAFYTVEALEIASMHTLLNVLIHLGGWHCDIGANGTL